MDSHESRDLDSVIDDVARAMTSMELARDLRPAVASRVSRPAEWTLVGQPWWRPGLAAAAVAVVVVAVVMRPAPEPLRPQRVADAGRPIVAKPVDSTGPASAPPSAASQAIRRTARPVARQTIVDTETAGVVDISPVAIVPLEGDDEEDTRLTSSHVVEIAPIDVEPLSISGLELVE
jgi:hypothetical protein